MLSVVCVLASVYALSSSGVRSQFGNLIFDEEFDTLDLSVWKHEITLSGGGNWEFEYYTNNRTNSYVNDGVLYLQPSLTSGTFTSNDFIHSGTISLWGGNPADMCTSNTDWGCQRTGSASNALNPIQSARLRTAESFSFNYGRIEVRAQLPKGDWLWPAIWLMPEQNSYGEWPASGEIDIVESRGNDHLIQPDGKDIGASTMGTTIHWGPYWGADRYDMTTVEYSLSGGALFSDDFHVWILEWTPNGFNCSCDGDVYYQVNTGSGYWNKGQFATNQPNSYNPWQYGGTDAPFDQNFYFILNVATGGTNGYFPTGSVSQPNGFSSYTQPWSDQSSTAYSDFWNAANSWYPTWDFPGSAQAAMKVDYIKVYSYDAEE